MPVLATWLFGLVLVQEPEFAGQPEQTEYEQAITALEEANVEVNRDPVANYQVLMDALDGLGPYGAELAEDAEARELVSLSMLNLARALLVAEDEDGAAMVMKEAIRGAQGRELPVERFGPTLVEFHAAQKAELDAAGTGEIEVDCAVSCRVLIDERPSPSASGPLYLGSYRVIIEATDGSDTRESHEVDLHHSGQVELLRFPQGGAPVDAPATGGSGRILPRWAEASLAGAGLAVIAAGAIALSFDGKCPGGLDPMADAADCPELYESTASGWTAIGLGAALAITGGVLLTYDEVKIARQRGHQATLTWTLRF